MDRAMSVEEKIRRAEEIYARRHGENINSSRTVKITESNTRKDVKLLKKMLIQVVICVLIYFIIYVVQNSQFIFSEQFLNSVNQVLEYDMNFKQIYENTRNFFVGIFNEFNNINQNNENKENQNMQTNEAINTTNDAAIGGAEAENAEQSGEKVDDGAVNQNAEQNQENLSQEEQDIANIKKTTSFIKPVEGTISSVFGHREPTTETVPTNHTGTDIAANLGTKIVSATDGEVVLKSEEGDYGKHLKVQIGDVSIIYAHCNQLYVEQGQMVKQGQEIAEVGSTGNSTGPHLHFEIRYQERVIDPQKILEL